MKHLLFTFLVFSNFITHAKNAEGYLIDFEGNRKEVTIDTPNFHFFTIQTSAGYVVNGDSKYIDPEEYFEFGYTHKGHVYRFQSVLKGFRLLVMEGELNVYYDYYMMASRRVVNRYIFKKSSGEILTQFFPKTSEKVLEYFECDAFEKAYASKKIKLRFIHKVAESYNESCSDVPFKYCIPIDKID